MRPDVTTSFNPAANKKKIRSEKLKIRSAKEKKERIWGKTPQKPYISSSIGDMARIMMRFACMENTYFYNTEPPPVEFYDYWQKFSVEPVSQPADFVDPKRTSTANMKKNTSSFNFFGQYTAPITSRHDLDDSGSAQKQKKRILTSDAQNISDIWKDVRVSMSSESFISSSTKISEDAAVVELETGWEDACSEDYQSSESDFGLDVQDKCRHHRHKQHYHWAMGLDSQNHLVDDTKQSSLEYHTPQGLLEKQANAIAQSILALQKKDNKILYELATQPRDLDIIDHFADDLDDSFLLDSYSYTDLPDEAFGPDFDFLNEEHLHKKKGKRGKKAAPEKKMKRKPKAEDEGPRVEVIKQSTTNVTDYGSSDSECDESTDDRCQIKLVGSSSKQKKPDHGRARAGQRGKDESTMKADGEGGYDACMERRRKRIEECLRNAVRCRSPMGSYKPKQGEEPLSHYKDDSSPGPAAYTPVLNGIKPNIHTAFICPRWTKNIYETPGPGPAKYVPGNKCTCEMLTLHESPRFEEDETIGPGPANVNLSNLYGTAKDKPKALIVSRKNKDKEGCGCDAEFTNCYGWTRFGKANPPKAIIIGRTDDGGKTDDRDYDVKDNNTRMGITIKSRIPVPDSEQRPGYYNLPSLIGDAPNPTFGIREFMEMKDQSPGPIYQLYPNKPKPVSLTFRPFPMRGAEDEPSPIEWGVGPGNAKNKTLPRAPHHDIAGKWKLIGEKGFTPGPNHYDICLECPECVYPGASFSGRYPVKTEVLPGPADYDPIPVFKRAPAAVFQTKKNLKEKNKWETITKFYDPPPRGPIAGGTIAPRWKSKENKKGGPELVNIFGFTNRGKKTGIPVSMKSRHTPFKYSHMADPKRVVYERGDANADCV